MLRLEPRPATPTEASAVVEAEIMEFNEYFKSLQADKMGMTGPEMMAIKSFCAYLLGYGPNNPREVT